MADFLHLLVPPVLCTFSSASLCLTLCNVSSEKSYWHPAQCICCLKRSMPQRGLWALYCNVQSDLSKHLKHLFSHMLAPLYSSCPWQHTVTSTRQQPRGGHVFGHLCVYLLTANLAHCQPNIFCAQMWLYDGYGNWKTPLHHKWLLAPQLFFYFLVFQGEIHR